MELKLDRLEDIRGETKGVLVAFSAGVDSTFLLKVVDGVLRDRAVALTASSPPRLREN